MGFYELQAGNIAQGTTTVAPSCAASAGSSLLVARIVSTAGGTQSTPPNANWQLAVPGSGGTHVQAEVWYYPNAPANITSATWTTTTGQTIWGQLSEYQTDIPAGMATDGVQAGTGGSGAVLSMQASIPSPGNAQSGDLAISLFAADYSSSQSGLTWTLPTGQDWTLDASQGNGKAMQVAGYWANNITPGSTQVTGKISADTGMTGWAACLAVFCQVPVHTVVPVGMCGGEQMSGIDFDHASGNWVLVGDVEGQFFSTDGQTWQPGMQGVTGITQACNSAVAFSKLEAAGTVYVCCGKKADTNDGGFMVNTNYGQGKWTIRSSKPSFQGNAAATQGNGGPRPAGEPDNADRSVGRLIAQDPGNGLVYVCTYDAGVMVSGSNPPGTSWNAIGLSAAGYYTRAIEINPAATNELWVGAWDSDSTGTFGGVWHTTNARAAGGPTWTQLNGLTSTVSMINWLPVNGNLYALSVTQGLFMATSGGGSFTSINGSVLNSGALAGCLWTGMDGYTDSSGNDVLILGNGNPGGLGSGSFHPNLWKVVIPPGYPATGSITYTDLLNASGHSLQMTTVPPTGRSWWKPVGGSFQNYLGGGDFSKPFVLINKNNTNVIGITGAGGFYKTTDGGTSWSQYTNGLVLNPVFCMAFDPDPTQPNHCIALADDYELMDWLDGVAYDNATTQTVGIQNGAECHAAAFDPVDFTTYVGCNQKYSHNVQGEVYSSPQYRGGSTAYNFTAMGLGAKVGGNGPIGMMADRDASNAKYLIVAVMGAGFWRYTSAGWSQVWTTGPAAGNLAGTLTFAHVTGSKTIFAWIGGKGLARSQNYGVAGSWSIIWSGSTAGGVIALDPTTPGNLWINGGTNLWLMTGAASTTPVTTAISNAPADIQTMTVGIDGTVYVVNGSTSANPVTKMYRSTDNGNTWHQADDGSVGQCCPQPRGMYCNPVTGRIYIASGYNLASYTSPAVAGQQTVALSDTAAAADALSVNITTGGTTNIQFRDVAAADDLVSVQAQSGPGTTFVTLTDLAAADDTEVTSAGAQPVPQADVGGVWDGIQVYTAPSEWILTAVSTSGDEVTFRVGPGQLTGINIALGQTFQLYTGPAAVTEDTSTPAIVTGTSVTSLTTASFSPPAASMLIAVAPWGSNTNTGGSLACTDSLSGSWTAGPVQRNSYGFAQIFYRYLTSAPGPMTVTVTGTGFTQACPALAVRVLNGAAASQSGAASVQTPGSGTSFSGSITTTKTGSLVYVGCSGYPAETAQGQETPLSGTTTLADPWPATTDVPDFAGKQTTPTGTPGAVTLGWTLPQSGSFAWVAQEIIPATAVLVAPQIYTITAIG